MTIRLDVALKFGQSGQKMSPIRLVPQHSRFWHVLISRFHHPRNRLWIKSCAPREWVCWVVLKALLSLGFCCIWSERVCCNADVCFLYVQQNLWNRKCGLWCSREVNGTLWKLKGNPTISFTIKEILWDPWRAVKFYRSFQLSHRGL